MKVQQSEMLSGHEMFLLTQRNAGGSNIVLLLARPGQGNVAVNQ